MKNSVSALSLMRYFYSFCSLVSSIIHLGNLLILRFIKTSFDDVFSQYFYEKVLRLFQKFVRKRDVIFMIFKFYANKGFELKSLIH